MVNPREQLRSISSIIEANPGISSQEALAIQTEGAQQYIAGVSEVLGVTPDEIHDMGGTRITQLLFETVETDEGIAS